VAVGPLIRCSAGEFGALVGTDRRRFAPEANDILEQAHDVMAAHAVIECNLDDLLGEIVDDRKRLDPPTVSQPVHDEVHGLDFLRSRWNQQGLALQRDACAPAPLAHCESREPVEPLDPLVVGLDAFAPQQHMDPAVAEAAPLVRQFDHARLERRVLRRRLGLIGQDGARQPRKPAGTTNRDLSLLRLVVTASRLCCGVSAVGLGPLSAPRCQASSRQATS